MLKRLCLMACLLCVCAASMVQAAPEPSGVHEYTLKNGLQILVRPDQRAPVVVSQLWYRVGSADEYGGITGISHALEHMMFKGTRRYPAGEFSRQIASRGGRENAFTSRDYTVYHQQIGAQHLEKLFILEADRMQNLTLPEDEFVQEMRVVKEERRLRTEDNPNALTFEHFNATAWLNSPYGIPVIGWMSDIEQYRVEDLRAWYQRFYMPNNAVLVVVGDVDPDTVHRLAQRHFGRIRAGTLPERKARTETPQRGERRIIVKAPAKLPYLLMGYKAPSAITAEHAWEPYALLVAAGVLSGGNSARLPSELQRRRELVTSARASYHAFAGRDTLFTLSAVPASGQSLLTVEKALTEAMTQLQKSPVSATELERVKAQVIADEIFGRDSIQGQAMQLGMFASLGLGWELSEQFAQRIRAVTAEQVQSVAQRYLHIDQRTVAWLEPQPINPDNPPSYFEGHLR